MKILVINYSIIIQKTSKAIAGGFVGYCYDTDNLSAKKTTPNYNNRKFTSLGILTKKEYDETADRILRMSGEKSLKYEEACLVPDQYILGHVASQKVAHGIYEINLIKSLLAVARKEFPEVDKIVVGVLNNNIYGELSGEYSNEAVRTYLNSINGIDMDKVSVIPGYFEILIKHAYDAHCAFGESAEKILYEVCDEIKRPKTYNPNPLLYSSNQFYFYNKSTKEENPSSGYEYVLSRFSKKDKFVEDGKAMSGFGVAILRLKEKEPLLEKVIDIHNNNITTKRLGMTAIGNLNAILDAKFCAEFMEKDKPFYQQDRRSDMDPVITCRSDGSILAEDSYRLIRKYDAEAMQGVIRSILDEFIRLEGFPPDKRPAVADDNSEAWTPVFGSDIVQVYDISSLIFQNDGKKAYALKELNSSGDVALPSLLRKEFTRKRLKLRLGYDLPLYRTLSKLTHPNTQVFLVLYDKTRNVPTANNSLSSCFERYCTVVKSDGDVSIWSSVYSNNLLSFLL